MITSVAVQAYLTRICELFRAQGFDESMPVVYDAETGSADAWLSDNLADAVMKRKRMSTKDTIRSGPFMVLFWTRSSLEPIVRQRYRLLDSPDTPGTGLAGKSTVSASFRIACSFVSNKAEAVEDLEEAFAAVFQNSYNIPLSLRYIYNSEAVKDKTTNFTVIQNLGENNLVNFKEGNLFSYTWGATIYMNYVSEFAWSKVYPVEKVVVDLYGPNGVPISSLNTMGHAVMRRRSANPADKVEVPVEPTVAFTATKPHDYVPFAITAPYAGAIVKIEPETRALIESAIGNVGGEVSIHRTPYMVIANMPLSANPPPPDALCGSGSGNAFDPDHEAYMISTAIALTEAIAAATGETYVVTPMPMEG